MDKAKEALRIWHIIRTHFVNEKNKHIVAWAKAYTECDMKTDALRKAHADIVTDKIREARDRLEVESNYLWQLYLLERENLSEGECCKSCE